MLNLLLNSFANMLYIDPAAASAIISSITAIAVAIGATIFVWWRSAKKKVAKALHIDENKNKEVEEDVVLTEDQTCSEQVADEPVQDSAEEQK